MFLQGYLLLLVLHHRRAQRPLRVYSIWWKKFCQISASSVVEQIMAQCSSWRMTALQSRQLFILCGHCKPYLPLSKTGSKFHKYLHDVVQSWNFHVAQLPFCITHLLLVILNRTAFEIIFHYTFSSLTLYMFTYNIVEWYMYLYLYAYYTFLITHRSEEPWACPYSQLMGLFIVL